ncbi:iron-sulfur cluster repair di-iron protein (plasmid) [Haloferax larsenii]|uniref:Iron-sulfur cluster repair di-iron protein n=1 Tax=Haloferax larsenii TaxID=302484 RepID=A0ABY5RJK4_HALLR|nr:iron-sulfur cluster repair di-iron protein [Haloferax larsenii]UVE52329.1 iron-sulfur cluster repair di-iron protein [Haloferax larsenii]
MMTDTIDPSRQVSSFVEESLAFAPVFEEFGIDYCCGGDVSLAAACDAADADIDDVRSELRTVQETETDESFDWESLSELTDHIVSTHHDRLREELPALEALVHKVANVHGEDHPELEAVEREFVALAEEMQTHIQEEEDDLFPIARKIDAGESLTGDEIRTIEREVEGFEDDHEATAERLERLSELTDDYAVPESACASYRSMLDRLAELERDTHLHVHKENNVLFPAVASTFGADT